jgi:hypothetical protein
MWEDNIKLDLGAICCMDWTDLAQARDQWRALVNMMMNNRVQQKFRNSWVAEGLAASQEGLSSMELVIKIHLP